jgi:peptidoglycan/LPS O-acetylase OafA/YrhL
VKNKKLEFANALRGPAAVFVLFSHFIHNAWVMRPPIERFANVRMPSEAVVPTPLYVNALNIFPSFEWGAYGVAIFFLVSGLVIPLSLKKYSTPAFIVSRIFRIWPVYIAGFSISILSMYLAGLYFGKPFQYSFSQVAIHYVPGIRDLLWSTNIDGIIWTLEIEIKFYVVCALIAPLIRRGSVMTFIAPLIIALCCFSVTGYMASHSPDLRAWQLIYTLALSGQFIVFMFTGTVFAYWREGDLSTPKAVIVATMLLGLFFCLVQWGPHKGIAIHAGSYVAAVVTFLLFAAYKWKAGRIMTFLASISYPLYASHIAMGYAIIAIALQFGASPKLAISLAFISAIVLAYVLHLLVEVPTHRLGQRIAHVITERRARRVPTEIAG